MWALDSGKWKLQVWRLGIASVSHAMELSETWGVQVDQFKSGGALEVFLQ